MTERQRAPAPRRGPRTLRQLAKYRTGILFLLPAVAVFGLFLWYPIVQNFFLAFQSYVPGFDKEWVGLANLKAVLHDPQLPRAIINTLEFVGLCLAIGFVVPIISAIALTEVRRGRSFFRLAIYVPNMIPGIALYIIWRWVFQPDVGLLNQVLGVFGLPHQLWILSPKQVMLSLALMATWANFGGTTVLYMAGLSSVNPELYEAAEIEGAGFFRRIFSVTLPGISSLILLLLVLQLIATFQVLQEPFVMTAGGPNNSSLTVMLLIYNYAFVDVEYGKAGALGSLLFLALLCFSWLYVKRSGLSAGKGA
jgi:multiple sugar transport system permease protein